jgi:polyphosphate glucokinase
MIAEHYCADSARKKLGLSWEEWGRRFNEYLLHLERTLAPDLIILGGGVSKQFNEYAPFFTLETPVKPAFLQNHAGTIGAAFHAWQYYNKNGTTNAL